jgi:hypothetical protein
MLRQMHTLPCRTEVEEKSYWRASWAEPDPAMALVHHYFFQAQDVEEAHEKIFAWMRQPGHALPVHARIVQDDWYSYLSPKYAQEIAQIIPKSNLVIWRIIWQEEGEKHVLLLFEPREQVGAAQRAQRWALARRESLEQFQMLERVPNVQSDEAIFCATEGSALFQP